MDIVDFHAYAGRIDAGAFAEISRRDAANEQIVPPDVRSRYQNIVDTMVQLSPLDDVDMIRASQNDSIKLAEWRILKTP